MLIHLEQSVYPVFLAKPVDYEELTVDGLVRTLTAAKVTNSRYIFLKVENGPVRMTLHGADPGPAFGFPLYDLDSFGLGYQEALQARFIRQGTINGTIRALYYQ